ncbi:unnamed protein product [Mytilus edulis]|uniref:Uncharacterized protein n=1 Tax=Mytilus edulis TaxID=6550 RepID=A0A8S3TEX6_MYTED|nr:unnamed protein product [Mytilus edulis]
MVCDAGFYLDIVSTFLLNMYEICHSSKVGITDEQKKDRRHKIETKLLFVRIAVGFSVNIVGFILVCALNRDTYISGSTATGLFSTIIVYTILLYTLVTLFLLWSLYYKHDEFTLTSQKNNLMTAYRVFEIVFDIFILFYSLVVSKWEVTDFTTATTVIACFDIILNISLCYKHCYCSNDDD